MKEMKMAVTHRVLLFVMMFGLAYQTHTASAHVFGPGFDLFATAPSPPSPMTFVDLGGPIGVVPLIGNPFGPGDTDTIVERLTGSGSPFDVGDVAVIPIELVALSLKSASPVDIGGTLFDMFIISGSMLGQPANPLGSMTVSHSDPNGGTFITNFLPINFKVTATEVLNPSNPPLIFSGSVVFQNTLGVWSHTPGPMDAHGGSLGAGGFYAGVDPRTGEKNLMAHVTPGEAHYTNPAMVPPPIPEPSTLAIWSMLGGIGVVVGFRRRGVKAA
jgi:hypothetical protein